MSGIRDLNLRRVWRVWGIRGLVVLLAMILLAGMVLVPLAVTYAQGQKTACPDCGGTGKVACSVCGGSGVRMCESCGGDGKTPCWLCGGGGKCYQCDGDGRLEALDMRCPICEGTGKCQVCHGTGQRECIVCDGKGQWACGNCGGDGQVLCTRCSGSGVIYIEEDSATEEDVITGIYEDTAGDKANVSAIKAELRNATREELEEALEEMHQYGEGYWLDPTNIYYNLLSQVRANQSLREIPPEEIEGYEFVGRTITKLSIQWAENVQAFGWADDPEMIHRVIPEMRVKNAMMEEETMISDHYRKLTEEASATEGAKLTGISGVVYVRKGGAGEWTQCDSGTVLKSGDEIKTTRWNSWVTIILPNGDRLRLAPMTSFTMRDPDKESFKLLIGKIWLEIQNKKSKFEGLDVYTPTAVCAVRGTEFTVSVDEDGATTVMVLDGFVEVRDLTSNAGITLQPRQMLTIPKGGLTQEEMLEKAELVWPDKVDRWWEEDLTATGEQSAPASSGIGVADIVAVAAIIIVVALVFVPLLRRRRGKSPG